MNFFFFFLQGDSQVQIRDVKYKNIRDTSSSKVAVAFECSKGKPCENIELNNINLTYHGAEGGVASSCSILMPKELLMVNNNPDLAYSTPVCIVFLEMKTIQVK